MRLICPNCAAQYEIDASLIPEGGRDVQCSNCGHAWFEDPEGAAAGVADEAGATRPAAERPRRRELDENTKRILREEAEREAAQRRRAAEAPVGEQTELGLDTAPGPGPTDATTDRAETADLAHEADDAAPGDPADAAGDTRRARDGSDAARQSAITAAASRGDLLPDIEQINSTLTATSKRQSAGKDGADDDEDDDASVRSRSGFGTGFALVLLLTAVALIVYVAAPRIAQLLPAAEPFLADYVAWVNGLRAALDDWLLWAGRTLTDMTGG